MAQREGSVYLWLFIVAMFLFVIVTVAFVMKFNEAKEIEGDKVAAVKEKENYFKRLGDMRDQRDELRALIVGEANVNEYTDNKMLIADTKGKKLADVRKVINAAHDDLGMTPIASFDGLCDPYESYASIFATYRRQRDESVTARKKADDQFTKGLASRTQNIADLSQKIGELRTQVAEAVQATEDCQGEKDATVARMTRELEDAEDACTEDKLQMRRQIQRLESEIATLTILVKQLQKKETKSKTLADALPDGSLIDVSSRLGKAWIDIGREHHLRPGLIFRVYQEIRGGKKLYKGRVEVRRVEEKHAEVAVIEEVDPNLRPMTTGDKITSPFYAQDERPVFVFAGVKLSTQEMTQDFVRSKLKGYGVEVRNDVSIDTSFLVALKDYEKTTEFKVAERLGIPILREQELMQFIGY